MMVLMLYMYVMVLSTMASLVGHVYCTYVYTYVVCVCVCVCVCSVQRGEDSEYHVCV